MDAVVDAFHVSVLILISIAALASVLVVWRDDHTGLDR